MFRAPDLCSRHRDFKHLHHLRVRQWGNCCLFPETILRSQNCSWRNLTSQGGGGYFQVCWTLCFPAKWLASRGRIKNVSPKPPTRSKDRVFLQCSKCGFAGLESHPSQFVIPSPSLTSFSPLHTPGLSPRGFLCCSGHFSHSAILLTSLHCSTKPLRLLGLAGFEIKSHLSLSQTFPVLIKRETECSDLETHGRYPGLKGFPCTGWVHFPF